MKLLRIEDNRATFLDETGQTRSLETINKNDLLWLVQEVLKTDSEVEIDEYNDATLQNQAHQIIYRSIYERLMDLRTRRKEFLDTSERLYLAEFEKYQPTRLEP